MVGESLDVSQCPCPIPNLCLVRLLMVHLLPFRLLLFRPLNIFNFIWFYLQHCYWFTKILQKFWRYSFKEHPLTVQIPKSFSWKHFFMGHGLTSTDIIWCTNTKIKVFAFLVYNTAFALLNEAAQTHLPIQPSRFVTDFEVAVTTLHKQYGGRFSN